MDRWEKCLRTIVVCGVATPFTYLEQAIAHFYSITMKPLPLRSTLRLNRWQCRTEGRAITLGQELIERDRQIAHANAGRVINGIGNSGGSSDNPNLADAFRAHRVDVRIVFIDP